MAVHSPRNMTTMSEQPKSLNGKLERIRSGAFAAEDFIIADAKDGDMAFGVTAPGPDGAGGWKSRADHLAAIRQMTESELVDIMLMSVSSAQRLAGEGVFSGSAVTPAVRLNDTTDIWNARGSNYRAFASQPFASADVASAAPFSNLGLYSMTFHNDVSVDLASLEAYRQFRLEMREQPVSHFLEIFNPAFDIGIPASDLGFYVNDMIIKALAGVVSSDQPLFLKIQFNGAAAMRELAAYDPTHLIVGILGGGKGTTRDTFELIGQAAESGARVALFGRKINLAEAPLELVRLMRATVEGKLTPEAAVTAYHEYLAEHSIPPERSLHDDMELTETVLKV